MRFELFGNRFELCAQHFELFEKLQSLTCLKNVLRKFELFEKLYEAFKAEYLKTVQMIPKQLKPVKTRSSEVE